MKNFLKTILILTTTALASGCVNQGVPSDLKEGKVTVQIEKGAEIVINTGNPQGVPSKAGSGVNVASFGVDITNAAGENAGKFSSYSDVPAELALDEGLYTMESQNDGVKSGAAFDKPLYHGKSTFTVKAGETTPVKVLCELQSTGVRVTCTANMLAILQNISITVNTKNGVLHYTTNDLRTGWFSIPDDGNITVSVQGVKASDGKTPIDKVATISSVKAKELRNVTLDITTTGSSESIISIDDKVISKDVTITVPDSDDVIDGGGGGSWEEDGGENPGGGTEDSGAPKIVGKSYGGTAFDLEQTVYVDPKLNKELVVEITSSDQAGLTNLFLTIDSELDLFNQTLASIGLVGEVDLANPDMEAPWGGMFADASIGIIDKNNPIKGKTTHLFSVGGLMSLLGEVDTTGGYAHKFKLRAVDAKGETIKTMTIELFY